jgi:hypothetical protein
MATVLKNQKELNPVLDSANYTLYKKYNIANTVKNSLLLYEQLPVEGITNIFNIHLKNIDNCPVFVDCINTNERENRKPLSSVYFTPRPVMKYVKQSVNTQCSACCYDTSINGVNNKKGNFFNTNFTKYSNYRLRKMLCEECKEVSKAPLLSLAANNRSITVTITNKEENAIYTYSINDGEDTVISFDDTNNPTLFTIFGMYDNTLYNVKVKATIGLEQAVSSSYLVATTPSILRIEFTPYLKSILVLIKDKKENVSYSYYCENVINFDEYGYKNIDLNNSSRFTITGLNIDTQYYLIIKATYDSAPVTTVTSEEYSITTEPIISWNILPDSITGRIKNKEVNVIYTYSFEDSEYRATTTFRDNIQFTITDGITTNTLYNIKVKATIGLEQAIASYTVATKPDIPLPLITPYLNSILVTITNKENVTYSYYCQPIDSVALIEIKNTILDESNTFTITGLNIDTMYELKIFATGVETKLSTVTNEYYTTTEPLLSVVPASNSITVTINNKEENVIYTYSINGGVDTDVIFEDTNNPTFFTITDGINSNTEYTINVKATIGLENAVSSYNITTLNTP